MSQLRKLAEQIPAEYRREILGMNMLMVAQANNTNQTMLYLCVIWKEYIEKEFEPDCNLCCARVLKNLKAMQPELIQLEKESQLLNQV